MRDLDARAQLEEKIKKTLVGFPEDWRPFRAPEEFVGLEAIIMRDIYLPVLSVESEYEIEQWKLQWARELAPEAALEIMANVALDPPDWVRSDPSNCEVVISEFFGVRFAGGPGLRMRPVVRNFHVIDSFKNQEETLSAALCGFHAKA